MYKGIINSATTLRTTKSTMGDAFSLSHPIQEQATFSAPCRLGSGRGDRHKHADPESNSVTQSSLNSTPLGDGYEESRHAIRDQMIIRGEFGPFKFRRDCQAFHCLIECQKSELHHHHVNSTRAITLLSSRFLQTMRSKSELVMASQSASLRRQNTSSSSKAILRQFSLRIWLQKQSQLKE